MNIKNIDVESLLDPAKNPSVVTAPTDTLEVHEDQRATVLIKDIITFKDAVNKLLKPDIQEHLTEKAISFNDITEQLNPNNLNLETGVYVTPVLGQPATFKASEGFHGLAEVHTKPLENVIIEKLAPSNFVRGEGILVQADLVKSAGIGQLTVKNLALNDKAAYVITQEDVETFSNTETNFIELDLTNMKVLTEIDGKPAVSTDAPVDTFGASKLYLNVPLVPNKNIKVDANNLGATLTPAGIPVNLDGTEADNKEGYGALGYKSITLDANLVSLPALTVLDTAKKGGGTLLPDGVSIGFNTVDIPDLTPQTYELRLAQQSTASQSATIVFDIEDVTIYDKLSYYLGPVPTREIDFTSYIVTAIGSKKFTKSTDLTFLPNGTGTGDSLMQVSTEELKTCEAISKFVLTLPGQYKPIIESSTISSLISTGCPSIKINSTGISAEKVGTLASHNYSNTKNILSEVEIKLPKATPEILIVSDCSIFVHDGKEYTKNKFYMNHSAYISSEIDSSYYTLTPDTDTHATNATLNITRYSSDGVHKIGLLNIYTNISHPQGLDLNLNKATSGDFSFTPTITIDGTVNTWSVKFYDTNGSEIDSEAAYGYNKDSFEGSTKVKNFFNLESTSGNTEGTRIKDNNLHLYVTQ